MNGSTIRSGSTRTILILWAYFTVGIVGGLLSVFGIILSLMAAFMESPLFLIGVPMSTLLLVLAGGAAMRLLDMECGR